MRTLIFFLIFIASITFWSQELKPQNVLRIGDTAPSFVAESTLGTIHFPEDYGRYWKIIFSHPKDFTPVCSSEILELANSEHEFNQLGAKLVIISTDQLSTHFNWEQALEEINYQGRGAKSINFPLVADPDYAIIKRYGMHHLNAKRGSNIRGVYFIDRENVIRAIFFYPVEVGRNTDEILRTLTALQKSDDDYNLLIPANWQPGKPVMISYSNRLMKENMEQINPIYFEYSWFMIFWDNK